MMIRENELLSYKEASLAELVKRFPGAVDILEKNSIDFCCCGNQQLTDACAQMGVDVYALLVEIAKIGNVDRGNFPQDFQNLESLTDYIVSTHHTFVRSQLPEIERHLLKASVVHEHKFPWLKDVLRAFRALSNELSRHLLKEENILFPFIIGMEKEKDHIEFTPPPFGSVQYPISMMEHEHENVGKMFRNIREHTCDYALPEEACATVQVSYYLLKEFENDLHRHIHLENNILFPEAVALEKSLYA